MKALVFLLLLITFANALLVPNLDVVKESNFPSVNTDEISQVEEPRSIDQLEPFDDEENYIVVLKNGHSSADYAAHQEWIKTKCSHKQKRSGIIQKITDKVWRQKERTLKTFNLGSFKGYTGKLPKEILYSLRESDMVDFIEKDEQVFLTEVKVQHGAPWGLERISHRILPNLEYFEKYIYNKSAGEGVTVYVIDSGIAANNPEFEDRVISTLQFGFRGVSKYKKDHGTHVAGIIGSKSYGVSKRVSLVSLEVFDENGLASISSVIMAVQHAIKGHKRRLIARDASYRGAVINILLGVLIPSAALDEAMKAAFNAGITIVVSSGNKHQDACGFSPARSKSVITVAATDYEDGFAPFSDWGSCVDLLAPGVSVESVGVEPGTTAIKSGTSMAAPHVSGVVALILSMQPPIDSEYSAGQLVSPIQVKKTLLKISTLGVINSVPASTPNRFLYNGGDEALTQ